MAGRVGDAKPGIIDDGEDELAVVLAQQEVRVEPLSEGVGGDRKLDYFQLLKGGPFGRGWQLLDEVTIHDDKSATGVIEYRPFGNLRDHFDTSKGLPNVMPGVIIVELGCAVAAALFRETDDAKSKLPVLDQIESFKFRGAVFPLDRLIIKVEVKEIRHGKAMIEIVATKDGAAKPSGSGRIIAGLMDKEVLLKVLGE